MDRSTGCDLATVELSGLGMNLLPPKVFNFSFLSKRNFWVYIYLIIQIPLLNYERFIECFLGP